MKYREAGWRDNDSGKHHKLFWDRSRWNPSCAIPNTSPTPRKHILPSTKQNAKKDDADEKIVLKFCHLDEQPIRSLLVLTGGVFFRPFEGTHYASFVLEFLRSPAQASFYPNRLKIHRLFWQAAACPYTKPSPFQAETCSLTEYRNRLIARAQIKPTASETSKSEDWSFNFTIPVEVHETWTKLHVEVLAALDKSRTIKNQTPRGPRLGFCKFQPKPWD